MLGALSREYIRAVWTMIFLLFAYLFAATAVRFSGDFPAGYAWSDLLLNYQGGVSRRGLLGEIAYRVDFLIPAPAFIPSLLAISYCALTLMILRIVGSNPTLASWLFLASPAGLLFPVYDRAAFGRKDVFILLAFAATVLLFRKTRLGVSIAGMLAIYGVACLFIEAAVFYMPMAFAVLALQRHESHDALDRLMIWAVGFASTALFLAIIHSIPTNVPARPDAIAASWRAIYPGLYAGDLAQFLLNSTLKQNISIAMIVMRSDVARNSYILAACLALIPTALAARRFSVPGIGPCTYLAVGICSACMFIPMLLAADWGRYIHLLSMHAFLFAAVFAEPPQRRLNWASSLVIAAVYASSWTMSHWTYSDTSALHPRRLLAH